MSVNQISIFLENKPGTMSELTRVLADNGINLRALSLAETESFGIVRVIVDDVYEATTVLKDAGYISRLTPVVIVEIPDEAGGLSRVLDVYTEAKVNVKYMYAILGGKRADKAYMIFSVDDEKKAEQALRGKGITVIDQEDVSSL